MERVDVGVLVAFVGELGTPRPHMRRPHRAEQHRPEAVLDPLDVGLCLPDRRITVAAIALQPGVAPLSDRQPSMAGCDVGAGE